MLPRFGLLQLPPFGLLAPVMVPAERSGNAFAYAAPDLEQGSRWLIQHNQIRPASERLVLNLLPTLQRSIDAGRAAEFRSARWSAHGASPSACGGRYLA